MKRDSNEQSLKQVLDHIVSHYRKNEKYRQAEIQLAWQEVIGSTLYNKTKSIFLKDKTLHIHLEMAVLKEELSFNKDQIIKAMNEDLGYHAIEDVVIK